MLRGQWRAETSQIWYRTGTEHKINGHDRNKLRSHAHLGQEEKTTPLPLGWNPYFDE